MRFRTVKKLISIVIVMILLLLCLSMGTNGYSIYTYSNYKDTNYTLFSQNGNQIFIIGSDNNTIYIDAVYPKCYNITLTLNSPVYSYNLCNDTLVIICPIYNSHQSEIVLYDISDDNLRSFNINTYSKLTSSQIAYSNNCVYLSFSNGRIEKYSTRGKLLHTYNLNSNFNCITVDYFGSVYALSNTGLYQLDDSNITTLSNQAFFQPALFIDDFSFVDGCGNMYDIYSDKVQKSTNFQSSVYYPSGGKLGDYNIIAKSDTIFAVSQSSDKAKKKLKLSNNIEQLYVVDDCVIAMTKVNSNPTISIIRFSEFIDIIQPTTPNTNKPGSNTNTSTSSKVENSNGNFDYNIYSDVYNINNDDMTISGISPSTTIGQFKKNIHYDGFDISFTKYNGKSIKSGNVGTATIVTFYNDYYRYEYELCVTGDLTGEGNVNSRDKNTMFDLLLDQVVLTGVYYDASDINNDSNADLIDLVLLMKMIG